MAIAAAEVDAAAPAGEGATAAVGEPSVLDPPFRVLAPSPDGGLDEDDSFIREDGGSGERDEEAEAEEADGGGTGQRRAEA